MVYNFELVLEILKIILWDSESLKSLTEIVFLFLHFKPSINLVMLMPQILIYLLWAMLLKICSVFEGFLVLFGPPENCLQPDSGLTHSSVPTAFESLLGI